MASAAQEQQWKDRYRELVRDFEEKEREWSALEKALRGAAGKLALAATGQSPVLDAAVDVVLATLRTELTAPGLDASVSGLVRVLQVQGVAGEIIVPPTAARASLPAPARADHEALLRRLVAAIGRVSPLKHVAAKLELRLDAGVEAADWERFIEDAADAVGQVIGSLEEQREELERFLQQVTHQLSEFERWTSWQEGAAQDRRDDTLGLERGMQAQMTGLHREMEAAPDLVSLKGKVQSRLDTVAQQLLTFRSKEERRHAENEKRTADLRQEVNKLRVRTDELTAICADQESRLMIDSLTGAHSRYAYDRRLEEEFQRWQRHSQPLTFSIWDIDSFKRINDEFGHDAGDRLLRGVADILAHNKRTEDFFARIGGEEFVLLLPMTALEAAQGVADKLRHSIETAAFRHHGRSVPVTISCGLTEFRSGDTVAAVYERADRALYQAKELGRNRCEVL